jgi:hypothetical protein
MIAVRGKSIGKDAPANRPLPWIEAAVITEVRFFIYFEQFWTPNPWCNLERALDTRHYIRTN